MTTKQYQNWINSLKKRYRSTQIKAAVAVNSAMLEFYWSLGADISRMYPGKKRNLKFFENLSNGLCLGIDNPRGLSTRNLKCALAFYQLSSYRQQVVADKADDNCLSEIEKDKPVDSYLQQVVEDKTEGNHSIQGNDQYLPEVVKVPWGHHTVSKLGAVVDETIATIEQGE